MRETGNLHHSRWDDRTPLYFRSGWIRAWAPSLLNENLPAEVEIDYGDDSRACERRLPRERWSWAYRRAREGFLLAVRTGEEFLSPGAGAVPARLDPIPAAARRARQPKPGDKGLETALPSQASLQAKKERL